MPHSQYSTIPLFLYSTYIINQFQEYYTKPIYLWLSFLICVKCITAFRCKTSLIYYLIYYSFYSKLSKSLHQIRYLYCKLKCNLEKLMYLFKWYCSKYFQHKAGKAVKKVIVNKSVYFAKNSALNRDIYPKRYRRQ